MALQPDDNDAGARWDRRSGMVAVDPAHPLHRGDVAEPETFKHLKRLLAESQEHNNTNNASFYLAVSDRFFGPAVEQLGHIAPIRQPQQAWRRLIVERPFGEGPVSGKAPDTPILGVPSEDQTYRIDHFIGKETAQNILVLRFANGTFESLWNRDHLEHVQITAADTAGVEGRARFYERTGALRDTVGNHLVPFARIAMELTISFDAIGMRAKKTALLQAHRAISPENLPEGRHGGIVLGQEVPAYRHEPKVTADPVTETYVTLNLDINQGWPQTAIRP